MPTAFAEQKSSAPEEPSEQDSLDVREVLPEEEDEDLLSGLSSSSSDAGRGEPSDEAGQIDGGIEPLDAFEPDFGELGVGDNQVDGAIDDLTKPASE